MTATTPVSPRVWTTPLRLVLVAWAMLGLWLAFLCWMDLSMAGFPDGYITPYDRVTGLPLTVIAWLTLAQALYFLFRALRARRLRLLGTLLQLVLAAALTLLPMRIIQTCPQWGLCGQAYQSLTGTYIDDGAGG